MRKVVGYSNKKDFGISLASLILLLEEEGIEVQNTTVTKYNKTTSNSLEYYVQEAVLVVLCKDVRAEFELQKIKETYL